MSDENNNPSPQIIKKDILFNYYDDQLIFKIKDNEIPCSKLLFCAQSDYPLQSNVIEIYNEYTTSNVVEAVQFLSEWINSNRNIIDNLNDKTSVILETLADRYGISELKSQINARMKERCKELYDLKTSENIENIIENIDKFLFIATSSDLIEIGYEQMMDILKQCVKKNKSFSLFSAIQMFYAKDIVNPKFTEDLSFLLKKSPMGVLLSCYFDYVNSSNEDEEMEYVEPPIKNEPEKSEFDFKIDELNQVIAEFDELGDEFTKLTDDFDKMENNFNEQKKGNKISFDLKIKNKGKYETQSKQQLDDIIKVAKKINDEAITKISEENQIRDEKCKEFKEFEIFSLESLKKCNSKDKGGFVLSKAFLRNISYRFVNDSVSEVLSLDLPETLESKALCCSQECFENLYLKMDLNEIENNGKNAVVCNINNDFLFCPLYYEIGFYKNPSKYSWDLLARFDRAEFRNGKGEIYESSYLKNVYNELNNQKNANDEKNANGEKNTNDENKNSNNANNVNNSKIRVSDNLIFSEEVSGDDSDWYIIHSHKEDEEIPSPDDSYDIRWDDPFKLTFAFEKDFFPSSIKLVLNQPEDPQGVKQCIKQCVYHFQVFGIEKKICFV